MKTPTDEGPRGALGDLPPECDPPLELPDLDEAVRQITSWRDNVATLSPAMDRALIALVVAGGIRTVSVRGVPPAIVTRLAPELYPSPGADVRLGYVAAIGLARRIEALGDDAICGARAVLEAVRLIELAAAGHVRWTLRLRHPLQDHWRRASVEVLFSSACPVFAGDASVGRRLLERVAAVDADAAAAAMLAELTGGQRLQ